MARAKASPLKAANLFLLAAAVGALGGLLSFVFQWAIRYFQVFRIGEQSDGTIVEAAAGLEPWQRVLVPAAGGLVAALCLMAIRGKRSPFGISDITGIAVTRKGRIRVRESLMQVLSSLSSISTGGSIGRESANSQLGATAGSALGGLFRCSTRERTVLLGCGVAAGMATSFNAPIAGALFVMEVVLGNFAMDVFAPVVVSAVIATLVTRGLHASSDQALYATGNIDLSDWRLVLSALLLGVICGVASIGFRKILRSGKDLFRRLGLPLIVSLPLGGALVGLIGIRYPEVWGNGQHVVVSIINGQYPLLTMLLAIVILKSVATSISLGSRAMGGLFTPVLVVGAAFGAAYAIGIEALLPLDQLGIAPADLHSGFALVGMAGLVAATAHAPITAVLLVFEFTRNYDLILPVMLCSIIGSLVARLIDRESAFTERLRDHGHLIPGGIEALAMQTNYVRDVMRTDVASVDHTASFDQVMEVFSKERHDNLYVVDDAGTLQGHIQIHDVKSFLNDPSLTRAVIAGDLTRSASAVNPDQTLAAIFDQFDDPDLEEIPVVTEDSPPMLKGRLTRRDVLALLSDEVLGQRVLRAKLKAEDNDEASFVQLPSGAHLARVAVPDAMVDRALDSLDLPAVARLTVLVVIKTSPDGVEHRVMPEPELVLPAGSSLIVLGTKEDIAAFDGGGQ